MKVRSADEVKALKASIRASKASASQLKKDVSVAQKRFLEAPDTANAKAYREAVSAHIKAYNLLKKAEAKLAG